MYRQGSCSLGSCLPSHCKRTVMRVPGDIYAGCKYLPHGTRVENLGKKSTQFQSDICLVWRWTEIYLGKGSVA